MRAAAPWVVLGAATAAAAVALGAVGFPSPTLFAALLVGLAAALARPQAGLHLPRGAFIAAQAVCGVTLGAYLQSDALRALARLVAAGHARQRGHARAEHGAGRVLARFTALDVPTATLGMIAGGASGIVTMADDLGGDDRLVAFMQYLRVLVVVLLTPMLIAVFGGGGEGTAGRRARARSATPRDWLLTAVIAPGAALAGPARGCPPGRCSAR